MDFIKLSQSNGQLLRIICSRLYRIYSSKHNNIKISYSFHKMGGRRVSINLKKLQFDTVKVNRKYVAKCRFCGGFLKTQVRHVWKYFSSTFFSCSKNFQLPQDGLFWNSMYSTYVIRYNVKYSKTFSIFCKIWYSEE